MKEKRKYSRFEHNIPFTLKMAEKTHKGVTGNLSQGGAYAESISPPISENHVGECGEITLHTEAEPIAMACRIVYVGGETIPFPKGVGIAFLD